jgi:serine/threonine-protein kinase
LQNLAGLDYGRFKIETLLGWGGFAAVYRAQEKATGETFVLKMLAPEYARDPAIKNMFFREASMILRLQHANLVKALRLDERYGRPYIVFPFERGQSLADLMPAPRCDRTCVVPGGPFRDSARYGPP